MDDAKGAHKVPAGLELLGRSILITQDVNRTSAYFADGPWYPANRGGPDVVAARVRQIREVERPARTEVRLVTSVGEIGWLPLGHGVLLVDED